MTKPPEAHSTSPGLLNLYAAQHYYTSDRQVLRTMSPNEESPSERRKAERVRVNLKARWEGVFEQKEGDIVDVSASGCFILTAHEVKPGELVRLEIEPSVVVWGEVIYQIEEMGFAIRFTAETGGEGQQLAQLVQAEKYRLEKEKSGKG